MRRILLVDDNEEYCELIRRIFASMRPDDELQCLLSTQQMVQQLDGEGHNLPDLIILDLLMPEPDGFGALQYLKQAPHLKSIPVIIWSSSDAVADPVMCYQAGANSYIKKPEELEDLKRFIDVTSKYWLEVVQLPYASRI